MSLHASSSGIVDFNGIPLASDATDQWTTNSGDTTPPTVTGINRLTPAAQLTKENSVIWEVKFSESVTGVNAADFALIGATSGASISGVNGSGDTWTVTVTTGVDGSLGLNLVDDDSIADAAGNKLGGTGTSGAADGSFTGQTYTIDRTAPTVQGVVRTTPTDQFTNAPSVVFTVTFSEPVSGVNLADFAFDTTGTLAGVSVTDVSPAAGPAAVYTVTVVTGTGDGDLRLDVPATATLQDGAGNAFAAAFTGGQLYTLDRTDPTVTFDDGDADDLVPAGVAVHYTIDVLDPNGVSATITAADIGNAGGASISVGTVTSAMITGGVRFTVPVTPTSGGELRLRLLDTASVSDPAGNAVALPVNDDTTVAVDASRPGVTVAVAAGQPSPVNTQPLRFTVTFDEPVVAFTPADLTLTGTAGGLGSAIVDVTNPGADGRTFQVAVSGLTSDGTVTVDVTADVTTDPAGNGNSAAPAPATVELDTAAPAVSAPELDASTDSGAAGDGVTNADPLTFTGTAEPGAEIELFEGSTLLGTATATGGVWSVTGVTLPEGPHTVFARATDAAGNSADSAATAIAIDRTAPVVQSVVRTTPPAELTNAASVTFTVTFSEALTGLDADDFTLTTSGLTGASVTTVTPGAGTTYTVTVNTGSGAGTVRLDVATGHADTAGNVLSAFTGGETYTIDRTAPGVQGIVRAAPPAQLTNATTVTFAVTFDEAVSGVDATDFALAGIVNGVSGTVGTPTTTDGGRTWSVPVTGLTHQGGSGDFRLDLIDDDSIADAAGNPLGGPGTGAFAGEAYTIDHVAPTVVSVERAGGSPANAGSVDFLVTFSEAMTDVDDLTDFAARATGVSGAAVTAVSPVSPTVYRVTVGTGSGDGSVGLDVADAAGTDAAGNPSAAFSGGEEYTIDRTVPYITAITRLSPVTQVTNAPSVTWQVTFNEAVTGVNEGDFLLTGPGAAAATFASVGGGGTTWMVEVNTGADGALGLDLVDDDSIRDAAGNALGQDGGPGDGGFTGPVYTVDRTAPDVVDIDPAGASPTNATGVTFTVTFTEAVSGVDATDFTVTSLSGDVTGTVGTPTTADGITWSVPVSGLTHTGAGGAFRLDLIDDASIADAAGNPLGGVGADDFTGGGAYSLDQVAPGVTAVTRQTPPGPLTNAGTVTWEVRFSEGVTGVNAADFALVGDGTITDVSGAGATWTVTATTGADGPLGLNLVADGSIIDAAGNPLGGGLTGEAYAVDRTAPAVVSITSTNPSPTNAAQVVFTVTFNEPVTGVGLGDFAVSAPGLPDAAVTGVSPLSASAYAVTVSTGVGEGQLRLDVSGAATVADQAGNSLASGFTGGQLVTVDTVAPAVLSVTRLDPDPTAEPAVRYRVTFREAVTGVNPSDFTLTTTGLVHGASVLGVEGDGATYTVTVNTGTGNGTIRLDMLNDGSIADAAGNVPDAGFNGGEEYTVSKPVTPADVTLAPGGTFRLRPGQALTVTATVAAVGTAGARTVTFLLDGAEVATVGITGNLAQTVIGGLPVGRYTLEARYDGDNQFLPGTSAATRLEVGTPSALFVFKAFEDLTGLTTSSRAAGWIAGLEAGRMNRTQVVMEMMRTPEYYQQVVREAYGRLLDRAPTAAELGLRVSLLARGQAVPAFQAWLMGQPEYFARNGGTAAGFRAAVIADLTADVFAPATRAALTAGLRAAAPGGSLLTLSARVRFVSTLMNSAAGRSATIQGLFGRHFGAGADGRLRTFVNLLRFARGYDQAVAALLGSTSYAP